MNKRIFSLRKSQERKGRDLTNSFQQRFDEFLQNQVQVLIFVSFYQEKEKSPSGQDK